MLVTVFYWQLYDGGTFMMLVNHYVADFFNVRIGHQDLKVVTNIRHQHRCSR